METTTFTQSNYINYYNAFQLSLPIDLGVKIDPDDEVVSFLKAIEGVNLSQYIKRNTGRGRKGYDPVMLLKIILFARMIGISDLRGLESLCKHDIRFMYIAQEETPSFMSFQRFEKDYLLESIDKIFFEISFHIGELMNINRDIQHIDGTKIEGDANKNTFVYRIRILKERKKLFTKITESIVSMNMERGFDFPYHHFYCAQEIGYIVQYLMEMMVQNDIEIVYGKGKRKDSIQRWYDLYLKYYIKLNEYEYWLDIIGQERWSCSKTDHDATMCATKIDYYCKTGISKPCYNAQIAVSDGIIVNADLFQRPGDPLTYIPFMNRYKEYAGELPTYTMADSAYGNYDNYMYCISNGMKIVMKYNMYAKKNTTKFKKKIYNLLNWEENEKGYKICPGGTVFDEHLYDCYDENGEYLRITQKYGNNQQCKGCSHAKECCKDKQRTISRNAVLDEFYAIIDEVLSTEFGKELKKQRSIQAEGAFGVIKQDMKFTRFTRKGLENTKMEFLIVCLGYNLKKYHKYRLREEKKSINRSQMN